MKPYKCPSCDGWGKREVHDPTSTAMNKVPCKSCGGKGVIVMGEESEPIPYIIVKPIYYPSPWKYPYPLVTWTSDTISTNCLGNY